MHDLRNINCIAFDADDTLWHNETLFTKTQDRFKSLLMKYHSEEWIDARLYQTEMKNLEHFGYGVKGFTLSMIETAVELSDGRISGSEITQIIAYSKEMLAEPVDLLEGIEDTISLLAHSFDLMIITKGDLFDQERKIAKSGIGDLFRQVEVVPRKTPDIYKKILRRQSVDPGNFMMVGNSLKSDVFPVSAIGGTGVHVPYVTTWEHEKPEQAEIDRNSFIEIDDIRKLPELLRFEASGE